MIENNKPLVTFVLFAYNQESFICEAVEAALAQTYTHLQIIISDDSSTDGTVGVIEKTLEAYRGPHTVVLNVNQINLGIGSHVNKLCKMAEGELIVVAAGDDVSRPDRTEKLVNAWILGGKRRASICSDVAAVDRDGVFLEKLSGAPFSGSIENGIRTYFSGVIGAAHAWRSDVFQVFGEMLENTVCEDRVIPLRSAFLGGAEYVPECLVNYRVHGDNVSHHFSVSEDQVIQRTLSIYRRNENIYENYCRDLAKAKQLDLVTADPVDFDRLILLASNLREKCRDKIDFLEGGVAKKVSLVYKYLVTDPAQAIRWLVILIAPGIYRSSQCRNLGIR